MHEWAGSRGRWDRNNTTTTTTTPTGEDEDWGWRVEKEGGSGINSDGGMWRVRNRGGVGVWRRIDGCGGGGLQRSGHLLFLLSCGGDCRLLQTGPLALNLNRTERFLCPYVWDGERSRQTESFPKQKQTAAALYIHLYIFIYTVDIRDHFYFYLTLLQFCPAVYFPDSPSYVIHIDLASAVSDPVHQCVTSVSPVCHQCVTSVSPVFGDGGDGRWSKSPCYSVYDLHCVGNFRWIKSKVNFSVSTLEESMDILKRGNIRVVFLLVESHIIWSWANAYRILSLGMGWLSVCEEESHSSHFLLSHSNSAVSQCRSEGSRRRISLPLQLSLWYQHLPRFKFTWLSES